MRFISDTQKPPKTSAKTLQVLAAGLPRCATSSLQAAFEETLGLSPCMHMAYVLPHVSRLKLVRAAMLESDKAKRQALLHSLFDGYAASADFPGMMFIDDLIEMYPDVKIVLNQRQSAEAWHRSITGTLKFFSTRRYHWMTWWIGTDYWHYQAQEAVKELWTRRHGFEDVFALESYRAHNEWVRDLARKRGVKVLEWEPSMGWGPLCEFLGKPVPETAFPRTNDEAFMKKLRIFLVARGLLAWLVVLSIPLVVVYAASWMRK